MSEAESVEEARGEVEPDGATPEVDESAETGSEEIAASDSEEAQAADDVEPESDENAEEGTSDPLDELAAKKYGGDRKKLVDGYWNLVNSGATLHKKLQALETELENIRTSRQEAAEEPEPDPVESDETVKWLDQQLESLGQKAQQDNQRQLQIINAIDKKREEIAELRGEMRRAEDYDKDILRGKLERAQEQLEALSEKWTTIEEGKSNILMRKFDLDHRKKLAVADVERSKVLKRQQAEVDAAYRKQFRSEFSDAVDAAVKGYGVSLDSKTRNRAYEYARAQAVLFLDNNKGSKIGDVGEFVKEHVAAYLEDAGVAKKVAFNKLSTAKSAAGRPVQIAKVNAPALARPQPKIPAGKMTAAQSLAYRKRIFGG
jgi:hypothetical protein